ncbi:MAG TPA: META domain-containing protein [Actinomycetota bacterium]
MRAGGAAVVMVMALVASACGAADPASDPARLAGVTWVLDAASTTSLATEAPTSARVDLRFEDDRASGTSGCNSYGGSYEAGDDGSLSFGDMMMSQMACEEALMALESAYLGSLGEVDRFQVSDAGLILEGGEVALTFVEEEAMEALPLEGTVWTLDTVAAGDAVSSALAGTEATLTLEGGLASGSGGCNRLSGDYTLDGAGLSFGPLATTKMACPDDVMGQEQAVLAALGDVAGWSVEGDRLALIDADGALLLGYVGTA